MLAPAYPDPSTPPAGCRCDCCGRWGVPGRRSCAACCDCPAFTPCHAHRSLMEQFAAHLDELRAVDGRRRLFRYGDRAI
jgi:hypothetical protein